MQCLVGWMIMRGKFMRAPSGGRSMKCLSPVNWLVKFIEWLYRENRFCGGNLKIGNNRIGPVTLTAPTLAAVNVNDDVAPIVSVKPFLDAMLIKDVRIVEIPGETGVCFQHLAILIGRETRAAVWPEIVSDGLACRSSRSARRALNQ